MSISVLIADDQPLVRAGLVKILEAESDMVIAAQASDGLQAVELAGTTRPDVALVDIRMPHLDGIAATAQIAGGGNDRTKVVILTTFGLDEYVYRSLKAGASGFLLKDAPAEDLVNAIRIVAAGDAILSPQITRSVIEGYVQTGAPDPDLRRRIDELTDREREVLRLLTRGLSNAELSHELIVSEATAKAHVARVLQKLHVRDRVQAVIAAYESGIVQPGSPR